MHADVMSASGMWSLYMVVEDMAVLGTVCGNSHTIHLHIQAVHARPAPDGDSDEEEVYFAERLMKPLPVSSKHFAVSQ